MAPNSILVKAKLVSCLSYQEIFSNSSPPVQTAKQSCELLLKVQPQVHPYSAIRLTFYRSSTLFSTTANWKRQVRKIRAQEEPNFDLIQL